MRSSTEPTRASVVHSDDWTTAHPSGLASVDLESFEADRTKSAEPRDSRRRRDGDGSKKPLQGRGFLAERTGLEDAAVSGNPTKQGESVGTLTVAGSGITALSSGSGSRAGRGQHASEDLRDALSVVRAMAADPAVEEHRREALRVVLETFD